MLLKVYYFLGIIISLYSITTVVIKITKKFQRRKMKKVVKKIIKKENEKSVKSKRRK